MPAKSLKPVLCLALVLSAILSGCTATSVRPPRSASEEGASGFASFSPQPLQLQSDDSLQFLLRQLKGDKLPPDRTASLVAEVLRCQADKTVAWNRLWGKFVELARTKGKLSDKIWCDYLLSAIQIQVSVADEAKRSGGLPIWVEHQFARTGGDGPPATARGWFEDDLSGIATNPVRAGDQPNYTKISLSAINGNGSGWSENLNDSCFVSLKVGQQNYHYRYHIEVFDGPEPLNSAAKPLGERVLEETIPWRLLAEDAASSLPPLLPDEALRTKIQDSIRVHYVLRDLKDTTLVQTMIQVDQPPTGMAFDMSLRAGNEIFPLGPVAWAKGEIGCWDYDTDLPVNTGKVDLILTSSAFAAERLKRDDPYRLIRLNEIWSGAPIIIPDVEVQSQEIEMCEIQSRSIEAAREDALEQLSHTDPALRQLAGDRDWPKTHQYVQEETQKHPDDPQAFYNLACASAADGDLADAMKSFIKVQELNPSAALHQKAQHQLRLICARNLQLAENGDAVSMRALGAAYEHGWGVTQVFQNAKHWYRDAANAGDAEAMCRLAAIYENETGATVHTDEAHEWYRNETREWYRKAAAMGNEEAKQWLSKN